MFIYILVLSILYAIISVLASVVVHELGHLLAARLLGIEVSAVKIGFGPEIVSFKDRYGVRWILAALLVGGCCCFPEQPGKRAKRGGRDGLRVLRNASPRDRAIVLLGGPASNLCLAAPFWLIISFHQILVPFVSDQLIFGFPAFFVGVSSGIALFNLLPIPPLDGGHLSLIALELLRGRPLSNEKQLIKLGAWVTACITVAVSILLLSPMAGRVFPPF